MAKRKLVTYKAKRDFKRTPEPSGAQKADGRRKAGGRRKVDRSKRARALRFVVQKHKASRLHYDFRLEADGVLKSWAVPKGPSLNPADKRLAMHVEDHPFEYRTFEGRIPAGNYGAGEVIVWDAGTYRTEDGSDPAAAIAAGAIKIILRGKKLRGSFALVRMGGRHSESNAWLLIKHNDEFADRRWSANAHPESVKTGRTLEDIKRARRPRLWRSNRAAS
jgi:bifunctional non-homologous end joining protein LigD